MQVNVQCFTVFLIMIVKNYAAEDCVSMDWWYDAIQYCLNKPDVDKECVRKCIQEELGYYDSSDLSLTKIKEQVNKNVEDDFVSANLNSIYGKCVPIANNIMDMCEKSEGLHTCVFEDPNMTSVLNKICEGPNYDFMISTS